MDGALVVAVAWRSRPRDLCWGHAWKLKSPSSRDDDAERKTWPVG